MNSITFANNPIDRASQLRSNIEWQQEAVISEKSLFMIFFEDKPLIKVSKDHTVKPEILWVSYQQLTPMLTNNISPLFLGIKDELPHFAIDLSGLNLEQILSLPSFAYSKFIDARSIAQNLDNPSTGIIAQAKSNFEWNKNNIYCSRCEGVKLETKDTGYKKCCNQCGAEYFPRVDPVVIMLPCYEDKCLLGRQKGFPPGMFSALAGFVEPGETIEAAVIREVNEEVGLNSRDVVYKFTQPWPFPSQLMIACTAIVDDPTYKVDDEEIEEAIWLNKEDLTKILVGKSEKRIWIPPPMAIAHQLIINWMENN
jgi:NAD+ diphosphatase|tara:strand:- start:858 stop:1790 length:933 start_codon:yes stop_codon:yes gene_type:complete